MAWFRKRKDDDVVWYRHRNYKGGLSEEEKRELDSIRWPAEPRPHPAAKFQDLPEEVQEYISHLELEVEGSKSFPPLIAIIAGISLIIYCALSALDVVQYSDMFPSIIKLSLVSFAWIGIGILEYRKVQKIWGEKDTDAQFMVNWELDYISGRRRYLSEKDKYAEIELPLG
jgi:hypothetical protein